MAVIWHLLRRLQDNVENKWMGENANGCQHCWQILLMRNRDIVQNYTKVLPLFGNKCSPDNLTIFKILNCTFIYILVFLVHYSFPPSLKHIHLVSSSVATVSTEKWTEVYGHEWVIFVRRAIYKWEGKIVGVFQRGNQPCFVINPMDVLSKAQGLYWFRENTSQLFFLTKKRTYKNVLFRAHWAPYKFK